MTDERLERWLSIVLETPGLTGIRDRDEARRALLEDALRGVPLVRELGGGTLVDVGSGGGTPGIPLAAALPELAVTLLEAEGRKAHFLGRWESEFPNVRVVWGRAESQGTEAYDIAVAKALAPPVVAAEWCLPLVREGGSVVLWVGPTADAATVERAAARIAGTCVESPPGFLVLRKVGPTPAGFPRRPGIARKRPLA